MTNYDDDALTEERIRNEMAAVCNNTKIRLTLTWLEARGLEALAGEGAASLLVDESAARSYVGGPQAVKAAERALEKLRKALAHF